MVISQSSLVRVKRVVDTKGSGAEKLTQVVAALTMRETILHRVNDLTCTITIWKCFIQDRSTLVRFQS